MPLQTEFINVITGLDTGSTPNNSVFYVMATEDNPQAQPPDPVTVGVAVVQGPIVQDLMRQPPQLNPNLIFASQGIDAGSTPNNIANWIMAVTDDPSSSGRQTLTSDLLGNATSTIPPQIGSGGM